MARASLFHEAPLEVLRQHPEVVLDLLALAGHRLHDAAVSVESVATDATEVIPAARSADFVAIVRRSADRSVAIVVVIEVQRRIDQRKTYSWPQYVAGLGAAHQAPVLLLVWTFDERVAGWARSVCTRGPSLRLDPTVVGPADLPTIPTTEVARAHIELTVLTALTRLGSRRQPRPAVEAEVLRVAEAVAHLPDEGRRRRYAAFLHGAARGRFRAILTKFLEMHGMGALEIIRNEGWHEGRAKGREEGREEGRVVSSRATLLRLLRLRGFAVDELLTARIEATTDVARLDVWVDRVLDARSVDDVFRDA